MKGFLVTQRISVSAFVESARTLISEGHFDSNEIEEILGDIEERWMDINMKVNDCEEWLCDLNTKHRSCRDTIGAITTFLDEAELVLRSLFSFEGDLENLREQKAKLGVSVDQCSYITRTLKKVHVQIRGISVNDKKTGV